MKHYFRTYSAIALAMIFWSLSFIWFKIANETFRPITIVFFRLIFSVALLSSYLLIKKKFVRIRREDRKLFILLATLEPFLYFLGESFGLTYVSATVGSVIISTIPVFAAIGAWMLFGEKLKIINYAGIVLSFIGVIIFVLGKEGALSFSLKGMALLFLAVISAVGYNLTLSRLVEYYNPVFIVNVQNSAGVILFLPLFLIFESGHFNSSPKTFSSFLPIIELAIFASSGAFILFAFSLRRIGISRANVFTNFIPVGTALFSFIILGEKLNIQNITGMAIVISGLLMAQINGRTKPAGDAMALTGKTA